MLRDGLVEDRSSRGLPVTDITRLAESERSGMLSLLDRAAPLRPYGGLIAYALLAVALAVLTRLSWRPVFDEPAYQLLLPKFVPLPTLDVLHSYEAAAGPLFLIVYGNLAAPFGFALPVLRIVSLILGGASLWLFSRTANRFNFANTTAPFLLVTPFLFTLSSLLMSDVMALLFSLASLGIILAAIEASRIGPVLSASLVAAMAGAAYTRQFYLFLPASLVAFALIGVPRGPFQRQLIAAGIAAIGLVVPIVVFWGGMVPDNPAVRTIQHVGLGRVTLSNLNLVIMWISLYLGPAFLAFGGYRLIRDRRLALVPILALPLLAVAMPLAMGKERLAGFYSSIILVLHIPGVFRIGLLIALWAFGLTVVAAVARAGFIKKDPKLLFLAILFCVISLSLAFSAGRLTERYFLPAIPPALLILSRLPVSRARALQTGGYILISCQALLTTVYFYNKLTGHFG